MAPDLRLACACLLALGLGSCGDDGKVGSKDLPPPGPPPAPGIPPSPSPPAVPPAPTLPPPPTAGATGGWAGTRPGDRLTWEVRVPGIDAVTTLTWTAERVDAARVEFRVESRTVSASVSSPAATPPHLLLSSSDTRSVHDAATDAVPPPGSPDTVTDASGRTWTDARKRVTRSPDGDTTVWTHPDLPMSGVVRSAGPGGAEQVLVSWARGG